MAPTDLAFVEHDGPLPGLPFNYVPAALAAIRGEVGGQALLARFDPGRRRASYEVVSAEVVGSPARMDLAGQRTPREAGRPDKVRLAEAPPPPEAAARAGPEAEPEGPGAPAGPAFTLLGPTEPEPKPWVPQAPEFPPADLDERDRAAPAPALVVVDHGIAFWNRRFRDGDGPLFRAIQFIDFTNGLVTSARLEPDEVRAHCATSDGPNGQARVRRALGETFPGSFWGAPQDPDGLWHGTAMADLAIGAAAARGGPRPLVFGVELPRASVAERGGDVLTTLLPAAIEAALALPADRADRPVAICLAFGFTGGPQDGAHPAARAIAESLSKARAAGRQATLVVPTGNHRQGRAAAALACGRGGWAELEWRLLHDDFSPSTVEVALPAGNFAPGASAPRLALRAPDGGTAEVALAPGRFALLRRGGETIGALHVLPVAEGGAHRLRLALARTARAGPAGPAPAGLWRLGLMAEGDALLWVLRDDTMAIDRGRPHRPSVLEDWIWRDRDRWGGWRLDDEPPDGGGPAPLVRRAGTISVLATSAGGGLRVVTATEERHEPALGQKAVPRDAFYAGAPLEAAKKGTIPGEVVERPSRGGGLEARGNGGRRTFRVSGTSGAAALAAGGLARALALGAPPS